VGLDTPPLVGLADTGPYLHDGSAATLREVLAERNPDDLHGVTSSLTDAEIDALVRYLLER
jgi:cytochrome c peroxidase